MIWRTEITIFTRDLHQLKNDTEINASNIFGNDANVIYKINIKYFLYRGTFPYQRISANDIVNVLFLVYQILHVSKSPSNSYLIFQN